MDDFLIFFSQKDEQLHKGLAQDPLGWGPLWSWFGHRLIPGLTTVSTGAVNFLVLLFMIDEVNQFLDEKGESFVKAIRYWFENDDIISIACYDWSKRLTDTKGWTDNLSIEITTKEFNEWLVNKAFN